MRRKSLKQRAYEASIAEDRYLWRLEQKKVCMICGQKGDFRGLQVHEITRRSHAKQKWWHRCNALLVCGDCHEGDLASMPAARQLAYKLKHDKENYDLTAWLILTEPRRLTVANEWVKDVHREYERIQ